MSRNRRGFAMLEGHRREILWLYAAGFGTDVIAERVGCCRSIVHKFVKSVGWRGST
jgi:hypothetical protein